MRKLTVYTSSITIVGGNLADKILVNGDEPHHTMDAFHTLSTPYTGCEKALSCLDTCPKVLVLLLVLYSLPMHTAPITHRCFRCIPVASVSHSSLHHCQNAHIQLLAPDSAIQPPLLNMIESYNYQKCPNVAPAPAGACVPISGPDDKASYCSYLARSSADM